MRSHVRRIRLIVAKKGLQVDYAIVGLESSELIARGEDLRMRQRSGFGGVRMSQARFA